MKKFLFILAIVIGLIILISFSGNSNMHIDRDTVEGLEIALIVIIQGIVMGGICYSIMDSKGYESNENGGFVMGFFFSILGLIACCAAPSKSMKLMQNPDSKNNSIKEKLLEIDKLRQENYITEEEYNEVRKNILKL